jgi:hypothetical protein
MVFSSVHATNWICFRILGRRPLKEHRNPVTRLSDWIFFRACVALRKILAVRKPRPLPRSRQAAGAIALCVATACSTLAGDGQLPTPAANADSAKFKAGDVRIRPVQDISTSISPPAGDLPDNTAQRLFAAESTIVAAQTGGRGWLDYAYLWQAPSLAYRPLYFEEPNLERYGHSAGHILQPVVSGAHFFAAVPALPAKIAMNRPWRHVYPLGYARPGSSAPWMHAW